MPATDRNHQAVIRSLSKAGWSVIQEQYSLAVGETADDLRRLYIDLAIQSQTHQLVLIEIKLLDQSPVHQFMMLVGQYLVYRSALDYLEQQDTRDYERLVRLSAFVGAVLCLRPREGTQTLPYNGISGKTLSLYDRLFVDPDTPLYVAIPSTDYQTMIEHPLGHQVMHTTLQHPVPLIVYDETEEEILQWIPEL